MGKVKVRIDVVLSFYNEFFIGGGKGIASIDSYMVKDIKGNPYIPGSSFKGKLRYNTTRVYNAVKNQGCNYIFSEEQYCKCDICRIFGEKENIKGELYFTNLNLIQNHKSIGDNFFSVRNGIQINRYLKVTKDQSLFSFETSGEGGNLEFSGKIEGYLSKDTYKKQILLLYAGFNLTDTLGGNQSRGLGWISEDKEFNIYIDEEKITKAMLAEWREEIEF